MMKRVFLLGLILLLCVSFIPRDLNAQVPRILQWQGQVTDANNQPINRTINAEFKIYDREYGGSPLWVEIQDISAVNGFVNVYLGTINPLSIPFDKQYWLEVKVGNSTPFPRTRMSAVAQSITSIMADTATYAIEVLPDGVNSAAIQSGAVTQEKLAPGVQAIPWGQAGGDLAGNYPNPTLRPGVVVENIDDGSITQNKLAPNVTTPPSGPASGDLTGTYPDPLIAVGAVKTDRIADQAVTTPKIADRAVTGIKIAQDAVGPYQLAPTGVDDGTYGDRYHVGSFMVDEDGRLTWAGNVLIGAVSNTWSDIDIVMGDINDLNMQIKPNTVGPVELISTTVDAGTYGDMYHVGSFMVDEDGRLTWAGNVLIGAASNTMSDITVALGEINNLNLQINPNTVGPSELMPTTVTAGTYGNQYHVGTFTVDEDGRLTAASNTLIQAQTADASDITIVGSDINNLNMQLDMDVVGTIELNAYTDNEMAKPETPADNGRLLYYVWDAMDPTRMRWTPPGVDEATLVWNSETNEFIWRSPIVNTEFPITGDGSTTYPVTFVDGNSLGQMFFWDTYVNDWRFTGGLSPVTPQFSYVMKWVDDGSTGYADWAPDGMTIPFYYMGTTEGETAFTIISTDLTAPAVAHFESTTSADAIHAAVPNNNTAGSAIVAMGGGSNQPTVHIVRNSDNALGMGALAVDVDLVTLESNSPAVMVDLNINGGDGYDSYGVWAMNSVTNPSSGTHYGGYFGVNAGANAVAVNAQGNQGMAIAGESSPVAPNSYVASMVRTTGNEGRTMYVEGASNNGDMLIMDPADIDDAVLVVRNMNASGLPGPDWNTAIKAYGDIWANSAVGASWLIGLDAVVIGDPNGLNTTLTPPLAPGDPLFIDTGIYVDGDVETSGTFIGDGSGLFDVAEDNTTASDINGNGNYSVMYYDPMGDWAWTVAPTEDKTALVYKDGSLTWSTIAVSFADITSGTNTSATMIVAEDAMLIPDPINPGIIRANEWVYEAPFFAEYAEIENLVATSATITNLSSTSGTFDFLQVNNQLDVGIGDGNSVTNLENLNVIGGALAYFMVPVIIDEELTTTGSATFNSNVQIDGMLNVDDATTLGSTLVTSGSATFDSDVLVNGVLLVDNNAAVTGTFENWGGIFNSSTFNNGSVFVDDNFWVSGDSEFDGDVNFNNRVGVDGDYGDPNEVFVVDADGTPIWTLSLNGLEYVNTDVLVVDESATVSDNLYVGGMLDVDGATTLGSTLVTSGSATFMSDVQIDGMLNVDDATTLGSTLVTAGSATFMSDVQIDGMLSVDDATTLGSTLVTSGSATFMSDVQIDGMLNVDDATTLGSTLVTSGSATFDNDVLVNGVLLVDNNAAVTGTFENWGGIFNSSTFNGGNVFVDDNFFVTGSSTFDGDVNFNGMVGVDGDYGDEFDVFVVGSDGEPIWTNSLTNLALVETTDLVASSATISTWLDVQGNSAFASGSTANFNGNTNLNGQTDLTGTFELNADPGEEGQVMISQGLAMTPVWTSDLTLENLEVTDTFVSSGSSTIGETYFNGDLQIDGNVDIGEIGTTFVLTVNGFQVPTLGSNTFTGLNLFGTDPSADPIPDGTILAAVTNHPTAPTVLFQNVGIGPVLELRGVEGNTAFAVTRGDALIQGATQITLSALTYTPDQALLVTAGSPVNEAAAIINNFNPDGLALKMPFGGFAMSTNYLSIPPNTDVVLEGEYTVWGVMPTGVNCGVDFPLGAQAGQIVYVLNLSGANDLSVNGLFTVPAGFSAGFVYIQIDGVGTMGWRQLFND